LFNADQPWNERIDNAPKDSQSDTIIAALQKRNWGLNRLQIDNSIDVLCAPAGTALRDFQQTDDFYPDECDVAKVPVPANGHVEGESGYQCTGDGDCHLIVIAQDTNKLYEQWRVDIQQSNYRGGCLAVWQLDQNYDATLRGDQCSSADAAGLPIAPLLFDADEVAAGAIEHAVRFALPNTHIRNRSYVRPATHATNAASAGADGVPYGARLRLRADYPLASLPNDAARTLARALQRYGMILADGGNVALMGQDDRGTTAKWDGLLDPHDLQTIKPSDFELVEAGERFTWQGECMLK
jgi:serine/threonine-protein kinase